MESGVESARVRLEGQEAQSTLFPLSPFSQKLVSPREFCMRTNLNWMSAQHLYENGWLSFNPAVVRELNRAQEAELGFLGTLVAAGCDETLLKQMLEGLHKPYAYRLDRIYYDWENRTWSLRPNIPEREAQFEAWIEDLVDAGRMPVLEMLRATIDRSIAELRRMRNNG